MARLDSLRVMLEREPVTSADRDSLRMETERLFTVLSQLSRANVEFNARIAAEVGRTAGAVTRMLVETGPSEGFRQFRLAVPRGWIGILADAPHIRRTLGDSEIIRYFDYPSIVSVEPNSPAARAGISVGDVLLAYNRTDLRDHEINLSRLFVPDRRLSVTVRRDGETKEYEMTVARASDASIHERMTTAVMVDSVMRARARPVAPGQRVLVQPLPSGGGGLVAAGGMPSRIMFSRSGLTSLWGAQLSSIGSGLARSLGVTSGVLVLSVVPATPADRSGLDDGDVIVKANGQAVSNVETLLRATAEHDADHALDLEVLRDKKPLKLTLRWAK
jgi:C-terminal processing protease CtpA/Prc